MNDKTWDVLLMAYLTNTLSEDDRADFDRYLADCEPCRDELREWQTITSAIRMDSEARGENPPALPAAFYQRLGAQPSANGSHTRLEQTMEENMTTLVGNIHTKKRKRSQGKPVTLAAAVVAVILGGLVLIAAGGPNPVQELPLAGVVEQNASATFTATPTFVPSAPAPSGLDPMMMTATAIIAGATGTAAVEDGIWTPDPFAMRQGSLELVLPSPTLPSGLDPMMLTATQIMVDATGTAAIEMGLPTPVPPAEITATPIPANISSPIPPTVVPPALSGMQPIVSAPAQLSAAVELPQGIGTAGILLSREGKVAAVLSLDGTVQFIDTATLETINQFAPPNTTVTAMNFDPNRNLFAIGTTGGEVYLLDGDTGTQGSVVEGDGVVTALTFSGDNKSLAIIRNGGSLNTLWLYDMAAASQSPVLIYDVPLAGAAFNADGSQIVVGTLDGRVLVLDVNAN